MNGTGTDGVHGSGPIWRGPATPSRGKLRSVIPRRMKVGLPTALILAFAFAIAMVPVIRVDVWLAQTGSLAVVPGEPAPVTVRVPPFADGEQAIAGGAIVVARGDTVDARTAAVVADVRAHTPHGLFGDLAYFAVVMALTFIYTLQLRRSNRGRFLRTQVVLLGSLVAASLVIKLLMLLTPMSVLAVPVALLALTAALAIDRETGVATGVLASIVVSLLVPFDIGVTAILLVQALTASLLLPDRIRRKWRVALWAGLAAAAAGVLAYGVVHYLTRGSAPVDELGRLSASSWIAAAVGGVIAAFATVPAVPGLQVLCGEITDGTLIALEDLSHPLLRQVAEKSPGTWQHSLAMANMAEIAANAIGANGRLVRVGAYFHDLGKSLQPKYFIENVEAGEQSPHDRLPPEVSCDAIFAHVTEGIALARRNKLPERIIDFMHMHHGDGVLEYFWAKCNEQGNPQQLSCEDFRYPGVPPQSRETAILAICDAVEAASRTLRRPDQKAIDSLVQRIVYGKLHLGQLDESGLSMADLRKINDSLRETIKHAHHGRIEYPWQRAEREEAERAQETHATVAARPQRPERESITQRIMDEPRLDSLDAPRPPWAAGGSGSGDRARRPSGEEIAATAPMSMPDVVGTQSIRPRTAMLADSVDVGHAAVAPAPATPAVVEAPVLIAHSADEPAARPPIEIVDSVDVVESVDSAPIVQAPPPRWSNTFAAAAEDALGKVAPRADTIEASPAYRVEAAIADAAAADDADAAAVPSAGDEPPTAVRRMRAPSRTPWGARIADKIDALLDAEGEEPSRPGDGVPEAAEPDTTVRRAPPPPPGARQKRSTEEVGGDDVEATIEIAPTGPIARGPVSGPPPATGAAPSSDDDDDDEPEVTIVPSRPPSSMMPPRQRTHGKPRE